MPEEGRRFKRANESFDVRYRRSGTLVGSWQKGGLLDISAVGMRMWGIDLFDQEEFVDVEINLPFARTPITIRGVVIWSRESQAGVYESGLDLGSLTLEQQASLDELVSFLNRSNKQSE